MASESPEPSHTPTGAETNPQLALGAEQVEMLRHDIKNELNALRMGVMLLEQLASSEGEISATSLTTIAGRIDRCLAQINEIVDEKIRIH
ncbi:MAG: hypothetical protein AAGJ83_03070 [Planctomycetota bacterium]